MSENNINYNQKLYEFADKINTETLELMEQYTTTLSEPVLQKIKTRIDILTPIRDLQLKEQQLQATQQLTQGDFMKNFNLKDLIGALKGNV